jgi:hypothetical protein
MKAPASSHRRMAQKWRCESNVLTPERSLHIVTKNRDQRTWSLSKQFRFANFFR